MDSNYRKFEIEITDECIDEMVEIYEYISINLKEKISAIKLISEVKKKILTLTENPELYVRLRKESRLEQEYHRIIVKNYVVLYTVDYTKNKIFISRMFYKKRNYFN